MSEISASEPRRTPRWVKLLLAASLAVNLLIAGMVGGAVWGKSKEDRGPRMGPAGGFAAITRALPKEDRRALGQKLRSAAGPRGAQGAALGAWITLLEAETFDVAAARDLAQTQMEQGQVLRTAGRDAALAHIAQMPQQARLQMAENLRKAQARRDARRP